MATQSENPVAENKTQTLTLRSSDGQEFMISESAAVLSGTIKSMVEEGCADNVIPIPNVDGAILFKIITFLNKHAAEGVSDDEKRKIDEEFLSGFQINVLFDVVLAANYLDIRELLEATCQKIADKMKNKSVKWVRKTFGVENDFTPEEEEQIMRENEWAFEDVESDDD